MISCHNFPGEGQTEGNVEKCTDFKPTEKHGKRAFLANHFPLAWQVSWEDIANISWPARTQTKVNGDMETLSCGIPYEHSASDSVCGAPAAPQTPPAGRKRGWQSPRRACHLDRQTDCWISDRTMYNLFDEAYPTPPTIRNFTMGKRKKQK